MCDFFGLENVSIKSLSDIPCDFFGLENVSIKTLSHTMCGLLSLDLVKNVMFDGLNNWKLSLQKSIKSNHSTLLFYVKRSFQTLSIIYVYLIT